MTQDSVHEDAGLTYTVGIDYKLAQYFWQAIWQHISSLKNVSHSVIPLLVTYSTEVILTDTEIYIQSAQYTLILTEKSTNCLNLIANN